MSRPENDESDTPRDESGALTIQLGRIGKNQGRVRRESRSSAGPRRVVLEVEPACVIRRGAPVVTRASTPTTACRSSAQRFNRSRQPPPPYRPHVQHSCRPQSAPVLNRFNRRLAALRQPQTA